MQKAQCHVKWHIRGKDIYEQEYATTMTQCKGQSGCILKYVLGLSRRANVKLHQYAVWRSSLMEFHYTTGIDRLVPIHQGHWCWWEGCCLRMLCFVELFMQSMTWSHSSTLPLFSQKITNITASVIRWNVSQYWASLSWITMSEKAMSRYP